MGIIEKCEGCRFFEPSYDFVNHEVNNPVICDRKGDCTKCGWNPVVARDRKKNFKFSSKSFGEDGQDLFSKPSDDARGLFG